MMAPPHDGHVYMRDGPWLLRGCYLHSMGDAVSAVRAGEPGGGEVLRRVRFLAGSGVTGTGGAQGGQRSVR